MSDGSVPGLRKVIDIIPAPPPDEAERNIRAAYLADVNSIRHERLEAVSKAEQQLITIERVLVDYRTQEQSLFDEYTTLIRSGDASNVEAIAMARTRKNEIHEIVSDVGLLRNVAKDRLAEARQSATDGAIRRAAEGRAVINRMKAAAA